MFEIGQKVKFQVELPIGKSGICEGEIGKIIPPRPDRDEGSAYLVVNIIEDGIPNADYRVDTDLAGDLEESFHLIK